MGGSGVWKGECVRENGGKFARVVARVVARVAVIVLLTGSVNCLSFLGKQSQIVGLSITFLVEVQRRLSGS